MLLLKKPQKENIYTHKFNTETNKNPPKSATEYAHMIKPTDAAETPQISKYVYMYTLYFNDETNKNLSKTSK